MEAMKKAVLYKAVIAALTSVALVGCGSDDNKNSGAKKLNLAELMPL